MNRWYLFFIFCTHLSLSFGQKDIQGVLIDSLSRQPIPFATLHIKGTQAGTLSNYKGEFELHSPRNAGALVVRSTGYEEKIIPISNLTSGATLFLTPQAQLVDEVTIIADDAILYRLVLGAKKSQSKKLKLAKTYFELESYEGTKQLELFQGYYNGEYQGYNVNELLLKKGRNAFSLKNGFFVSLATSKVMHMHKLFSSSDYFPTHSLELKKRHLFKYYKLHLATKYRDDSNNTIYKIVCTPKIEDGTYFKTTVWIDSSTYNLRKAQLHISDASRHPFQSITGKNELELIELKITKQFIEKDREMRVNTIDFAYSIRLNSEDTIRTISTRSVLYAYDYDEVFDLPLFKEQEGHYSADYHRVQVLPYDSLFWACTDELKIKNTAAHDDVFISDSSTILGNQIIGQKGRKNVLTPYKIWSQNRIRLRSIEDGQSKNEAYIAALEYNLKGRIYLDINELCDTITYSTHSIFDTYESYYNLPQDNSTMAFINIYFDLIEIERRKLNLLLDKCSNKTEMIQVYQDRLIKLERTTSNYFEEVERGTNNEALQKWNSLVEKELGLNNIKIFQVVKPEK